MKKTALIAICFSFFYFLNIAWGETDFQRYTKLAKNGDPKAQYKLSLLYAYGDEGVPQNYTEAAKWCRKAAEQGLSMAQFSLGNAYYLGKGVPKNLIKAYVWWSLASTNGYEKAKKHLERFHHNLTPQQISKAQKEATDLSERIKKSYVKAAREKELENAIYYDENSGLEWLSGPDRDTNWNDAKSWVENLRSHFKTSYSLA